MSKGAGLPPAAGHIDESSTIQHPLARSTAVHSYTNYRTSALVVLMAPSRRTIIMNSFRPAKEVDEPELFAGRASEVAQLADALHVIGSIPLIYGDRGLGKTSLAIQMGWIAMGSVELLSTLKIGDRAFSEDEQFIIVFVTCEDDTQDFDGLVQLLINEAEKADFTQPQQGYKPKHLT